MPLDYVQAHKWFNLSSVNDKDETQRKQTAFNRDFVAGKMTASQIAKAQKLAREWQPKTSTSGN